MLLKSLLLFFILLEGCSHPIQNASQQSTQHSVYSRPTVDVSIEQQPQSPRITLGESGDYGPTGKGDLTGTENYTDLVQHTSLESSHLAISIFLGAAGSSIFAEIAFLKELQKNNIQLSSYSGVGLGAVLASYLALGEKLSHIEWRFYLFFKKSKKLPLYSEPWLKVAQKYLLQPFKGQQVNNLQKNLVILLYDKHLHRVMPQYRGDLYSLLRYNMDLASFRNRRFFSAIGKPISLSFFKHDLAADYTIAVVPLVEEKLKFKYPSGFLVGNFEKELSVRRSEYIDADLSVSLDVERDTWLDSVSHMEKYLLNVKKNSEMIILQLRHSLNNYIMNKELKQ